MLIDVTVLFSVAVCIICFERIVLIIGGCYND
jgi:hypothetical protein